jgi:predicted Zn-ribbon and HTH transcriptional regulator
MEVIIPIKGYKCLKCNHSWIPKKKYPTRCPRCKSYKWAENIKKLKGGKRNVKTKI